MNEGGLSHYSGLRIVPHSRCADRLPYRPSRANVIPAVAMIKQMTAKRPFRLVSFRTSES